MKLKQMEYKQTILKSFKIILNATSWFMRICVYY